VARGPVAGKNLESLPAHDIRKKTRPFDHRPAGSSPPDLDRCTPDLDRGQLFGSLRMSGQKPQKTAKNPKISRRRPRAGLR